MMMMLVTEYNDHDVDRGDYHGHDVDEWIKTKEH